MKDTKSLAIEIDNKKHDLMRLEKMLHDVVYEELGYRPEKIRADFMTLYLSGLRDPLSAPALRRFYKLGFRKVSALVDDGTLLGKVFDQQCLVPEGKESAVPKGEEAAE